MEVKYNKRGYKVGLLISFKFIFASFESVRHKAIYQTFQEMLKILKLK